MNMLADTDQYLTFRVGQEEFGTEVQNVKEVLEVLPITKVPRTPDYMKGVINVRGKVISVIDMRLKLGIPVSERTEDTCIIVMEIGEEAVVGALVDKVQEVIVLESEQIEPAPKIGAGIDTDFLQGIGAKDEGFIMILDAQKVMVEESLDQVPKPELNPANN